MRKWTHRALDGLMLVLGACVVASMANAALTSSTWMFRVVAACFAVSVACTLVAVVRSHHPV
ncbi:MAG: hypothetical protein FWE71_14955 [Nocardioidaceae bacterium]|nr:hypothetical protein [Nocardioidaceae bacterium]MCL2613211.1 hypothetical protein [Nocardioidaceae bacterium]